MRVGAGDYSGAQEKDDREKFCIDSEFIAAARKRLKAGKTGLVSEISYILVTGANWAGGVIGDFELTVDKGEPNALVSFCGEGVKKIAPTQFQMKASAYAPRRNLHILIMRTD
jgi:hypothetical protein